MTEQELEITKQYFLKENIELSDLEISKIENETKLQGMSKRWRDERSKRITASNFGQVVKSKTKLNVAAIVERFVD